MDSKESQAWLTENEIYNKAMAWDELEKRIKEGDFDCNANWWHGFNHALDQIKVLMKQLMDEKHCAQSHPENPVSNLLAKDTQP
jgi:hypothetical protein